jgi:hypothetical protein
MVRIDSIAQALVALRAPRQHDQAQPSAWRPLRLLIPLALLHGLLYLALTPPWQHYDEPTHFEYARLIALWGRVPGLQEVDASTNREIADSMYRFRFNPPEARPNLLGSEAPNIGLNEKVHPPLYYAVAAVPIGWLRYLGVEPQLYAARMVGVLLYALVVACAWRSATILAPDRPVVQLVVPLLVMLVPAFGNQMSSVNNDVLVNFGITAMLLGCVLLIRDGPRPLPLCLAALSLAVAVLSKRTALLGAPPLALALFWSLQRRPLRWWIWAAAAVALVALAALAAFQYGADGWSVRPWLDDLGQHYLRVSLDTFVASLTDWERNIRVYPIVARRLFSGFWAYFGWGQVVLGPAWELALLGVALAGAVGLIAIGARGWRTLPLWQQRSIWLLAFATIVTCCTAVLRVHADQSSYLPTGRYVHPAMLPAIWLLVLGFEGLFPPRWHMYALFGLTLFLALLDLTAWGYTISSFYYR